MPLTDYGKCVFMRSDGKLHSLNWKSFTEIPGREKTELLDLLFTGEYVLTYMAVPKHLIVKGEKQNA